jgi:hypothetical protein
MELKPLSQEHHEINSACICHTPSCAKSIVNDCEGASFLAVPAEVNTPSSMDIAFFFVWVGNVLPEE